MKPYAEQPQLSQTFLQFSKSNEATRGRRLLRFSWIEQLEQYTPWSTSEIAISVILIVAFLASL